jgi:hypothetical protein
MKLTSPLTNLLSASILALSACGTSVLGAGNGGAGGTGSTNSNGSSSSGSGALTPVACGLGVCFALVELGPSAACPTSTTSADEVCDGLDNDCNGIVDEGCACPDLSVQPCYTASPATRSVGRCHDGTQQCGKAVWGSCEGAVIPTAEVCDNGLDDDCNGLVDDGCPCTPGLVEPCYDGPDNTVNIGACRQGTQTCQADGTWGACVGQVLPAPETCNGVDDDCNGKIDDTSGC